MDNSAQQSSETGATETGSETGAPENPLEQIEALLSDEGHEEEDTDDGEDEGSEGDEQPSPDSLEAVAERLGVGIDELYGIKVKLTEGDQAVEKTLGELKDQVTEASAFEVDKLAWEEERTQREHELVKTQQTITDLVSMLPKSAITPELRQALERRRADVIRREEELTRSVIPEWRDSEVAARDRAAMNEHLEEWGFGPNYVDNILDHKTLRYIRETMRRESRIREALEKVKAVRKPGPKSSATPTPGQRNRSNVKRPVRRTTSNVDKVVELLGEVSTD